MLFAVHLTLFGLAHASIKVYFSAVWNLYSASSQHEAYQKSLTPHLEQLLRYIKKDEAVKCTLMVCLPISVEIMSEMYSSLSKFPTDYLSIMVWAASCTAFFGFLRVGEMAVPSMESFHQTVHLTLEDVQGV